jgi:BNR repeat-like domain
MDSGEVFRTKPHCLITGYHKEGEMKRSIFIFPVLGAFLFALTAQADWLPAKRLTWNSGTSKAAALAMDSSGNLHLVWQDDTLGDWDIFYKRSTDGGTTWTAAQRLTVNPGWAQNVSISVETPTVLHLVWNDTTDGFPEIYYKKSQNGGSTWTIDKRLTWADGYCMTPDIAVDLSANIHVVWMDNTPGNFDIYYRGSTDGGATWSIKKRLTWNSGDSGIPVIAVDSLGNLHVVWQDNTSGSFEIYYRKSTDGGANWTSTKRLTWNSGDSGIPVIAADSSGHLHVLWYDTTPGNEEIYYKQSTDGGANWTASKRITWTSGNSSAPTLSSGPGDNLHVVWHDRTPGNFDIYYKNSPDGGATWITNKRLTYTSGSSLSPDIVADSSGNLHVVWNDATPGNIEIYYRKFVK